MAVLATAVGSHNHFNRLVEGCQSLTDGRGANSGNPVTADERDIYCVAKKLEIDCLNIICRFCEGELRVRRRF